MLLILFGNMAQETIGIQTIQALVYIFIGVMFAIVGLDQYIKVKKRFAKTLGKVKPIHDERKTTTTNKRYDRPYDNFDNGNYFHVIRLCCSDYRLFRKWLNTTSNNGIHNSRCCCSDSISTSEGQFEETQQDME